MDLDTVVRLTAVICIALFWVHTALVRKAITHNMKEFNTTELKPKLCREKKWRQK